MTDRIRSVWSLLDRYDFLAVLSALALGAVLWSLAPLPASPPPAPPPFHGVVPVNHPRCFAPFTLDVEHFPGCPDLQMDEVRAT